MKKTIWPAALLAAALLGGCSAAGVVASSDPRVKVAQAEELQHQAHYGRAKQLLDDAYAIVQKQGDELGAAHVYRGYGIFYRDGGSDDLILARPGATPTPTSDGLAKAQGYFAQSAAIFEQHKTYDMLSNVDFLMAQVSYRMNARPVPAGLWIAALMPTGRRWPPIPDRRLN